MFRGKCTLAGGTFLLRSSSCRLDYLRTALGPQDSAMRNSPSHTNDHPEPFLKRSDFALLQSTTLDCRGIVHRHAPIRLLKPGVWFLWHSLERPICGSIVQDRGPVVAEIFRELQPPVRSFVCKRKRGSQCTLCKWMLLLVQSWGPWTR